MILNIINVVVLSVISGHVSLSSATITNNCIPWRSVVDLWCWCEIISGALRRCGWRRSWGGTSND